MQRIKRNLETYHWAILPKLAAAAIFFAGCFALRSLAQQQSQTTFSSPQEAVKALVTAAQNDDQKALLDILGPEGKQIISSGDDIEDAQNRTNFLQRYQEMHRLVKEPDGTTTLYVGAENWPLPIPLASKGGSWYFDTPGAKQEILYRRLGRNELSAIRVCQELVAAQKEYYAGHFKYARKFFSDKEQHNGLYWKAAEGEPQSPIGPLVASAVSEGYPPPRSDLSPIPYRGYYFRILTRQGTGARGGRMSYLVDGKMTAGFAFLAYPAEYRSSGVMTFIVGEDGIVFRKDLGNNTPALASAMQEYNPNSSWKKEEDLQEKTARGQTNNP